MDIFTLINQLEEMVKQAKQPLLNKDQIILDGHEVNSLIDLMRQKIPVAIQEAQWVKRDEERIISAAQEEHDKVIASAKARAEELISEHEITRRAEAEAESLVFHAQQQAHEITEGAFNYANDIMEKLENQLTVYYEVVQEGRADIQQSLDSLQSSRPMAYHAEEDAEEE